MDVFLDLIAAFRQHDFDLVESRAHRVVHWQRAGSLEHSRRHGEMADLLIDPPVRKFGMMDVQSFDRIVQAGYDRTRELLES